MGARTGVSPERKIGSLVQKEFAFFCAVYFASNASAFLLTVMVLQKIVKRADYGTY